jgi:hypothetical protein
MNEFSALRAHIRQLKHAVATTTCRKTIDALRQMLSEAEAKLWAIEPRPPAGGMTESTLSNQNDRFRATKKYSRGALPKCKVGSEDKGIGRFVAS